MSQQIMIDADKRFVKEVMHVLARKNQSTVGKLVRRALEQAYGEQIEEIERFLSPEGVASAQQVVQKPARKS